jgi:hypothetical protein
MIDSNLRNHQGRLVIANNPIADLYRCHKAPLIVIDFADQPRLIDAPDDTEAALSG